MSVLHRVALTVLLPLAVPGVACAHAAAAPAVQVRGAWVRVLPGNLPHAGYATLVNDGARAVRLVSADSPAYRKVMLHRSVESGGVSRMQAVDQLVIPAHGEVKLAPGGYHLMLMHAVKPVQVGSRVEITLHFADGRSRRAAFLARPANASGPAD